MVKYLTDIQRRLEAYGGRAKEIHFLRGREDFGELYGGGRLSLPPKGCRPWELVFRYSFGILSKKKSGCATAAATAVAGTLRPHPACFPTTTYEEEDT
jgi:hypothetical protein